MSCNDTDDRAGIASPANNGTSGYVLSTDGNGNTSWVAAGGGGTVTNIATGTGLTGGPITGTGTISLANTAVTPGSYTSANITVDAQGRLTAASNGSGGSAGAAQVDAVMLDNVSLSAPGTTFDSYSPVAGELLLLINQATPSENGVYVFDTDVTPLVRSTGWDTAASFTPGKMLAVKNGTKFLRTIWTNVTSVSILETDSISFDINGFSPGVVPYQLVPFNNAGIGLGTSGNMWGNSYITNFNDATNVAVVDINSKILQDATATASVKWGDRQLIDSVGGLSALWETRGLIALDQSLALNWNDRVLYDTNQDPAMAWGDVERITSYKVFQLFNSSSDPGGTGPGDMYFNTTINKIKFYNGTTWETVTSV